MREITEIIVHCTATPEGRDVKMTEIDAWHRAGGFRMVGYHYVVALDGTIMKGRPEASVGAHCVGHNAGSIGVCYVGGLLSDGRTPADTRTPAQKTALRHLVDDLCRRYPRATVHGHREFAAKACPCFDVPADL